MTDPNQIPPPENKNIMNPALVSNVAVLGGYALVALIIVCATILAAIHDGGYSQQAFDLFKWIGVSVGLGAPATALTHTLRRNGG